VNITVLGEPRYPSPLRRSVHDQACIPARIVHEPGVPPQEEQLFELAGPRAKLYFDPGKTRAGIVTCGGLCPGLNNVIRSLFLELHHNYGIQEALGFRDGYQGLDPERGREPIGLLHDRFIHVPIELLATQPKRIDTDSPGWNAVPAATGQPERFE
jgi:6-phosphofructokinase 1